MTDSNTLAHYNIKHFGELSTDRKVSCYQYPTDVGSESIASSCSDRICIQCKSDHSFRGNFEDVITSIDLLTELFPGLFRIEHPQLKVE